MTTAQLISAVSSGLFALIAAIMGVRLIWLWRRTRGLPELCIGLGFVTLLGVVVPCVAISGLGRANAGAVVHPALMLGMFALWFGVSCMFAFTWLAFRPRVAWAKGFAALGSLGIGVIGVGVVRSLLLAPPEMGAFEAASAWTAWIRVPLLVFYGWTGVEAIHQYGLARRRLAIGLGDPVTANRFILWGWLGASQVLVYGVNLVLHAQGMSSTTNPVAQMTLAVGAMFGAILLYLTFLPPSAYVRFIRSRAGAIARA